jgi:hypothetical protein
MARACVCHPERPHLAKGMCSQCYWKARYADPETGKAIRAYQKAYYDETRKDPSAHRAYLDYHKQYNGRRTG